MSFPVPTVISSHKRDSINRLGHTARASGAGWATSVAKVGGILGPIIGGAVLSSGLPVIRSYALLAVCPAILFSCALGIHFALRRRAGTPVGAQPRTSIEGPALPGR